MFREMRVSLKDRIESMHLSLVSDLWTLLDNQQFLQSFKTNINAICGLDEQYGSLMPETARVGTIYPPGKSRLLERVKRNLLGSEISHQGKGLNETKFHVFLMEFPNPKLRLFAYIQ